MSGKYGKRSFLGFRKPNYTPVPDQFFDEVLDDLSGAETKVALYIIRRTFGFKKDSDDISLSQMVNGITTKSGRVLDKGTGLGKASVIRSCKTLEERGVIIRTRRQSAERGYESTTYSLNIIGSSDDEPDSQSTSNGGSDNPQGDNGGNERDTPLSQNETSLVSKSDTPLSQNETYNKQGPNTQLPTTVNGSKNPINDLSRLELDEAQVRDTAYYIGQKLGESDAHSHKFHLSVAWRIPKHIIERHLDDILESRPDNPASVFTHRMKEVARKNLNKSEVQKFEDLAKKMTDY